MSTSSAACDSLMKTVQVVCIDHSDSRPSWIPERRTNAMTVSVRSTSSMRSVVSTSMVSATTAKPPAVADVVFGDGRFAHGDHRALAHQLHCSVTISWFNDTYPDRKGSGCKAHTVPPL